MNSYFKNLGKIEFLITYACTGRCKHCSEGIHASCGEHIDGETAEIIVRKLSEEYEIKTLMCFGGEPLLYPDVTERIMSVGKEVGIPKRQVITNGFFSRDEVKIRAVAQSLALSGVNELLLSVDAFHQETIPLKIVKTFAEEATKCGIPVKLQPAWLVSRTDANPYNEKTREILDSFRDMKIPTSEGNVVFPEGNAKIYLAEYFKDSAPENPYIEDPCNVKCISVEPNGNVLGRNIYKNDIIEILSQYVPKQAL